MAARAYCGGATSTPCVRPARPRPAAAIDPRRWAAPRPSGLRRRVPICAGCRPTTAAPALRRHRGRHDLGAARPGDDRLRGARRPSAAGRALHAARHARRVRDLRHEPARRRRRAPPPRRSCWPRAVADLSAGGRRRSTRPWPRRWCSSAASCSSLAGLLRLGFVAQFLSRPVMAGLRLRPRDLRHRQPAAEAVRGREGRRRHDRAVRPPRSAHLGDTSGATLVGRCGRARAPVRRRAVRARAAGRADRAGARHRASARRSTCPRTAWRSSARSRAGCRRSASRTSTAATLPVLLAAAAGMVLVIFSESLGAAQTFAAKHGYEIDPNQELIALGVANAGSGARGRSRGRRQPLAVGGQRGRRRAVGAVAARRRRRWRSSPCSS